MAEVLDDDGNPVDTSCNCDLDSPCTYPPCVAEREAEMRAMHAEYKAGRLDPPLDPWSAEIADQLRDAGRGHLVREDQ